MKKKFFILIALAFMTAPAEAQDYDCHANANPDRGFNSPLDLKIPGSKVGSDFELTSGLIVKKIGTVTEISVLRVDDPVSRDAFKSVLKYIAEVSGTPKKTLLKVTSIQVFRDGNSDLEVTVYRLFVNKKQVGGTLVIDGHGTTCT